MLLFKNLRNYWATIRLGMILLAMTLAIGTKSPALAIDARAQVSAIIPIKGAATTPDGASRLCVTYAWACAKSGRILQVGEAEMGVLRAVNSRANRIIRSITDLQQYQMAERWALPSKMGGDCEDYALAKKRDLIRTGFPAEQLLIATLLDRKRQSHAVLVVKTGVQDLVLDNLTDQILPWQKTGYTFLRMQDPRNPRRWVSVMAGGIFSKN